MINIKDITYTPDLTEISAYIAMPLYDEFFDYMSSLYQPLVKIEYSKDTWARGWNVKLRKAGKALCVIYPKEGYFTLLVVVGKKEKERAERLYPDFSEDMQRVYDETQEGMGQRWLMMDIKADDGIYRDALRLIQIRRESK